MVGGYVIVLVHRWKMEGGAGKKLNQTYANQPKSFKESKVNETIHFLFTSIYDQFYLETAA
jgi:hypothetical protein